MSKSKVDNKKIIAHLESKWKSRSCPMCNGGPWNVQDSIYQLTEYNEGSFVVGGPLIPVIPITCENCGHTVLVNAILSGALPLSTTSAKEGK